MHKINDWGKFYGKNLSFAHALKLIIGDSRMSKSRVCAGVNENAVQTVQNCHCVSFDPFCIEFEMKNLMKNSNFSSEFHPRKIELKQQNKFQASTKTTDCAKCYPQIFNFLNEILHISM